MSQQNNPLYSDRTKIQRGLMSVATRVDSPDDQSLLVDAANWMSKYGLGQAAIDAVMAEAKRLCDDATLTALEDAKEKAVRSAIEGRSQKSPHTNSE